MSVRQPPEQELSLRPNQHTDFSHVALKKTGQRRYPLTYIKENAWGYLFLLPSLTLFTLFLFYPLLRSIYMSLFLTDPQGRIVEFVGMENYLSMFRDSRFLKNILTSGLFALYTVPTTILIALPVAYLTHQNIRGKQIFQLIFSSPLALSVGTASIIWGLLYHPSMGVFNYFLSLLKLSPVFWLADPNWALLSVSGPHTSLAHKMRRMEG